MLVDEGTLNLIRDFNRNVTVTTIEKEYHIQKGFRRIIEAVEMKSMNNYHEIVLIKYLEPIDNDHDSYYMVLVKCNRIVDIAIAVTSSEANPK